MHTPPARTPLRVPCRRAGQSSVAFVAVNGQQAEDWNGASGREFIEQRERHERVLGRLRARLLAAAAVQEGECVLDVGCGCGETTRLGTHQPQHQLPELNKARLSRQGPVSDPDIN